MSSKFSFILIVVDISYRPHTNVHIQLWCISEITARKTIAAQNSRRIIHIKSCRHATKMISESVPSQTCVTIVDMLKFKHKDIINITGKFKV